MQEEIVTTTTTVIEETFVETFGRELAAKLNNQVIVERPLGDNPYRWSGWGPEVYT